MALDVVVFWIIN